MKLHIEKMPSVNAVKVELTVDSSKKPIAVVLDNSQITALTGLLATAMKSTDFMFSIEL